MTSRMTSQILEAVLSIRDAPPAEPIGGTPEPFSASSPRQSPFPSPSPGGVDPHRRRSAQSLLAAASSSSTLGSPPSSPLASHWAFRRAAAGSEKAPLHSTTTPTKAAAAPLSSTPALGPSGDDSGSPLGGGRELLRVGWVDVVNVLTVPRST